jgi:hypothetical protein
MILRYLLNPKAKCLQEINTDFLDLSCKKYKL